MTRKSPGQFALQPIGVADLAVASVVHGACFDESWSETSIAELLAMPGGFGLLAMVEDQPAGLAIAYSVGAEGEIITLCTLPAYRRRGIAARLLAGVLDRLVRQECRRVLLEVAADNLPARSLYRRAGFSEAGRRTGYYLREASLRIDAIVLASNIGAAKASGPAMPST